MLYFDHPGKFFIKDDGTIQIAKSFDLLGGSC
jgi:hypothetical protein